MTIQDYLAAFDQWLSQHIYAASKAGKDLAFRDRRLNCALKLDDDAGAWDYVLLEPGAAPPPGRDWSVYRLHGVELTDAPIDFSVHKARRGRYAIIAELAEAVFGAAPGWTHAIR